MVRRRFWLRQIEQAWKTRSLVWLMGVRRVGKTMLAQSLRPNHYLDCELPPVRRLREDPESFWRERRGQVVVLDEIHRLGNPAEVLKIGCDHFPETRILATGSTALGASARFRDTLAGRKAEVWLTPMNSRDVGDFGGNLQRRLHHGGLPPFFLSGDVPVRDFQEWMGCLLGQRYPGVVSTRAPVFVSKVCRTSVRAERGSVRSIQLCPAL